MGGRRPIMADLAQGGSLEQDADAVALLHKPDPEDDIVTLILDKQRNGDTGMVNLLFRRSINKFEQATPFD
jgi:replicative DNA helicase